MPNVVRENIDDLNAVLKIAIGRSDYEEKFNQELKKISKTAALKGFRKGKTPVSFLKKMYGKSLLSDIITKMLQEQLEVALGEDRTPYLGQPIASKDFQPVDFHTDSLQDYEFTFDIGLAPVFELRGLDGGTYYDFYEVQVPEDKVDERMNGFRKYHGTRTDVADTIQEEDYVTFNAQELDGDKIKEDGWKTTFSILVNRMEDGDLKQELLSKKAGDTIRFNVFNLEKGASPEHVKKYLLNLTDADLQEGTETGEEYEAVIETVGRVAPAEIDQAFLDKVFGENGAGSEAEARDIIRQNLGAKDITTANSILYHDLREKLLELNRADMPLPEDYLRRWVEVSYANRAAGILANFEDFTDDMRWNLIKNKLFRQYDFQLTEDELQQAAVSKVLGYFGGQYQPFMDEMINKMVERIMKDEEQLNTLATEAMSNKLFFKIKEEISLNKVTIPAEELTQKMAAIQAANQARNALLDTAANSDEEE